MQITPDINITAHTIRAYRQHEVDLFIPVRTSDLAASDKPLKNHKSLNQSFIVSPNKLVENWGVESPQQLTEKHFQELLSLKPEIVIIGTGANIFFADSQHTLPLLQAGIGVEFMNTSAACRTYNFLVSDGRDVLAAIFMIE